MRTLLAIVISLASTFAQTSENSDAASRSWAVVQGRMYYYCGATAHFPERGV